MVLFFVGNIFTPKIKETLAPKSQSLKDAAIIELDTVDSTNNYAMHLIDADTAQDGLTVIAGAQTAGRGQRGRSWMSEAGEGLFMSIIIAPGCGLEAQFCFNAHVAVAVAKVLEGLYEYWNVQVKWPNDIIINDKKTGGLLVENVLRGNIWAYSIIGLGLNVRQTHLPAALPHATSLAIASSGRQFDIRQLANRIREGVFALMDERLFTRYGMDIFKDYLFKCNEWQTFTDGRQIWKAQILDVERDGKLKVRLEGGHIARYTHGMVQWVW